MTNDERPMSERFSATLRTEADPIWRRIFENPFLREVEQGTLPLEKFRFYLAQDYLYLEGFGRAVALALAKAPDSRNLAELSRRMVTPVERPLHRKLMGLAGITPEEADRTALAPTNIAYINHMMASAVLGGTGTDRGGPASLSLELPRDRRPPPAGGAPRIQPVGPRLQ